MDSLLDFIWFWVIFFGVFSYIIVCAITLWIVRYKKTWQNVLAGIAVFVFTPILFLIVWLPLQYLYDKKSGKLNNNNDKT